ncbi:MAG: hypothetical protein GY706_13330, partial [Bacteroides sp.]|nr:hypothetical protein [Bacteroides sp.]
MATRANSKSPTKDIHSSRSEDNINASTMSQVSIRVTGTSAEQLPTSAGTLPTDNAEKKDAPIFNLSARHTELPPHLIKSHTDMKDAYKEPEPINIEDIKVKQLLEFQIIKFDSENDLPNFLHTTNALQYFRVLRDMIFDWSRAKSHQKNMIDSLMSDQTPPGLRIHKQLEVINSSPLLK